MRNIILHPQRERLKLNEDQLGRLSGWLTVEVEQALAARIQQEELWRELLRQYDGVPKRPVRNDIIENAPNIEITLGAIAADSIYAQAIDLIYNINPLVTCRAANAAFAQTVKPFQVWNDFMTRNESNIRLASEDALLDDIQLGTGVLFIPWVEDVYKTKISTVYERGPRIMPIPIEDFIVPGGSRGDIKNLRWKSARFWYNDYEMSVRKKQNGWNTEGVIPCGTIGWVRNRRETLSRTSSNTKIGYLYEIHYVFCEYDIDDDGIPESMLVTWDRSSRRIMKYAYKPYDCDPFSSMVYQRRAHLFYGISALEVTRPYQDVVTETYMMNLLNLMIANCRFWGVREGAVAPNTKLWPNKILPLPNPKEDLVGIQMGDVYPSARINEQATIALAEQRVGSNELVNRPSELFGSRTPATTTVTALAQVNKRFTPVFSGMRNCLSDAIKQCHLRYRERLLMGDANVQQHILKAIGNANDALAIMDVYRDPDFERGMQIELTASDVAINKDADRQNALNLMGMLAQYAERILQLLAVASSPQTPPPVASAARKIAIAATEIVDRVIRTFDQVRDPETFLVNFDEEINQSANPGTQALQGVNMFLQGMFPPGPAQASPVATLGNGNGAGG